MTSAPSTDEPLQRLRSWCGEFRPKVALVLGSGWGEISRACRVEQELSYLQMPSLGATGVPGHEGRVLIGRWAEHPVIIFSGRLHHYEGHPHRKVWQIVHIADRLGAETVFMTNAAGGIRADLSPGSLMALSAHISWVGKDAWRAFAEAPATRQAYCPRLREHLMKAAAAVGVPLAEGVYAQVTGPCYETPAEIRALRACGADAVGMSTGKECEVAHAMGMSCVGLSCITNAAAGLSSAPIHHDEVTTVARSKADAMCALIEEFLNTYHSTAARTRTDDRGAADAV